MASSEEASTSTEESGEQRGTKAKDEHLRVSKDDMFMILALWMENFPIDEDPTNLVDEDSTTKSDDKYPCLKVGAVLVLPNEIVLAADCSREGVHAVARLLMKHHDKAMGCKMFMSRKPCRICAKLLVQSRVKRVLFLPREPEYYQDPETETDTEDDLETPNNIQMKQVDIMFTVSPIAQTKFVLQVEESVLQKAKDETPTTNREEALALKDELTKDYHFDANSPWLNDIKKKLPWPAFDEKTKTRVQQRFAEVMEWIARVLISSGGHENARGPDFKFMDAKDSKKPNSSDFNPVKNPIHKKQAKRFIEMARFLAQRTDDPKTAVGAVIVSYPEMEIISIGWNGFPLKAHYGDFARASYDVDAEDNKFPYVIHAEQNALMMRNTKNIKDAILFVTKSPCDECAPLIAMEGIKTVVVDADVKFRQDKEPKKNEYVLNYNVFFKMVTEERKFICYQTEKDEPQWDEPPKDSNGKHPSGDAKRKSEFDSTSQQGKVPKTK